MTDDDPYHATTPYPKIDIEKYDTEGDETLTLTLADDSESTITDRAHDADTPQEAVQLPDGSREITFTITNSGSEELVDVTVTDRVVAGGARLDTMQCRFPGSAAATPGVRVEDGSWQVAWAESARTLEDPARFAVGGRFTCTATLTGLEVGQLHTDSASVTGVGVRSGVRVGDQDDYNARRPPAVLPRTGGDASLLAGLLGVGLLAGGAGLMWASRRARRSDDPFG